MILYCTLAATIRSIDPFAYQGINPVALEVFLADTGNTALLAGLIALFFGLHSTLLRLKMTVAECKRRRLRLFRCVVALYAVMFVFVATMSFLESYVNYYFFRCVKLLFGAVTLFAIMCYCAKTRHDMAKMAGNMAKRLSVTPDTELRETRVASIKDFEQRLTCFFYFVSFFSLLCVFGMVYFGGTSIALLEGDYRMDGTFALANGGHLVLARRDGPEATKRTLKKVFHSVLVLYIAQVARWNFEFCTGTFFRLSFSAELILCLLHQHVTDRGPLSDNLPVECEKREGKEAERRTRGGCW